MHPWVRGFLDDFSEISINDKALFDRFLQLYNPQASEYTFTNFFMWRYYYRFRYSVIGDYLCVVACPQDSEPYALAPIGEKAGEGFEDAVEKLRGYFLKKGWKMRFKKVAEDDLARFNLFLKSSGSCTFDRDNSDYVYRTEDLIRLKGKKFHGKRNHINKFLRLYSYEYVPLTEELTGECARILDDWCAVRNCECGRDEYCEKYATIEVLDNFRQLRCKGALIKVGNRFEAFTIGERMNSDTAVIHIEKANFAVEGLYSFINQQFCEREWSHIPYINREEDLGQEGLRKAKLSYNPIKMINKYTIELE